MNATDIHDDDLRRRFDTIAARAEMPVVDPLADLRRARAARRRRRLAQAGGGLVAAAAVSAVVIGNLSGGEPNAGSHIANDPTPTTRVDQSRNVVNESPDAEAFREHVGQVLDRPAPITGFGGAVLYDSGATSLATYEFSWSEQVTLDIRAGVSREVLEWNLAKDTSEVFVGDVMAEKGNWSVGNDAYLFDQPDGDVVMVVVDGPAGDAPPGEVISTLLTEVDVPTSTLTPAQAWEDTLMGIGLDALVGDGLSVGTDGIQISDGSVLAQASEGGRRTGFVRWQAQTLAADTPDCPPGFTNCGTLQIAGETFRSLYVEGGDRAGWLYLERDHGGVRAQMILEPYEDGWALPLEAAAELLLDGRWSELAPESSVPYPSA